MLLYSSHKEKQQKKCRQIFAFKRTYNQKISIWNLWNIECNIVPWQWVKCYFQKNVNLVIGLNPSCIWNLKISKQREIVNPLSANPTKSSNTLKQFVGKLPTNCLSLFDHFVGLALKGLKLENWYYCESFYESKSYDQMLIKD